jgi:hypothetical protein
VGGHVATVCSGSHSSREQQQQQQQRRRPPLPPPPPLTHRHVIHCHSLPVHLHHHLHQALGCRHIAMGRQIDIQIWMQAQQV